MSLTTDFIAELYRAANEVSRLGGVERVQLLERAMVTIRSMTEQIEAKGNLVGAVSAAWHVWPEFLVFAEDQRKQASARAVPEWAARAFDEAPSC